MPATAGRVRMPANNRVHSSAALQTHGIWQSAIGYDPYAPDRKDAAAEPGIPVPTGAENTYDSFQGLLQLARIQSNPAADEPRGACKKCGRVGHLSYQCRNLINVAAKEETAPVSEIKPGKEERRQAHDSGDGSDSDEESDSDSDVDSEMERALAEREGWKLKRDSHKSSSKKSKKRSHRRNDEDSSSESDEEDEELERKHRSKKKKKSKSHSSKRSKSRRDDSPSSSGDDDDDSDDHRSKKRHRHKSRKSSSRSRKEYYSSDESDGSREKRREKKRSKSKKAEY